MRIQSAVCLGLLVYLVQGIQLITDFGAIPRVDTVSAQFINAKAIQKAVMAANSSDIDRVVKIPKGTFYSMPIILENIHNLSIVIEGKLSASRNITAWPFYQNSTQKIDFLVIRKSSKIEISGSGTIDGRGYKWWVKEWMKLRGIQGSNIKRPHLILVESSTQFKVHDLVLKNSACFHMRLADTADFEIYNLDIKVNTTAQFQLTKRFTLGNVLPTFPLNTDGIDPSGINYHIWNITVQNYDDVVVPKPSHIGNKYNCTENMLVENITIRLGVGLSIGSVPPNTQHNCVRNITFRNSVFQKPFKGVYVKTNPGNQGSGEIKNIFYQNITMHEPIWWAIYIGPQQQKQPGGGGPGCMLYPFDPKGTCQTQPRIDVRNITLENVVVKNSLLFPIIVRCNQTNPCTGIHFKNVVVDRWLIGKKHDGYVCENVKGTQDGGYPRMACLQEPSLRQDKGELQVLSHQKELEMIKEVWRRLEESIKQFPYISEDDEMEEESLLSE